MLIDYIKMLYECIDLQKDATPQQLRQLTTLEQRIRHKIKEKDRINRANRYVKSVTSTLNK